jgi:2-oxoisovalerate dehydrogenase E1 component
MPRRADATALDRVPFVDRAFVARVADLGPPGPLRDPASLREPLRPGSRLSAQVALDLFHAQLLSRHLDFAARELKQRGAGFYTIGSAGHEGNAAVAAALRPGDPALLHYRSGAFFLERARQLGREDEALASVLLGLVASSDEPIAGGRHKVFGSLPLWIPPQTSTIASHLPKSVGMAFGIDRARRLGLALPLAHDAIVACSFGDASLNHSTALGAINAACWCAFQDVPIPLLLVCEDNGIGISVPTPESWIAETYRDRAGLYYVPADGLDLAAAFEAASHAADHVRRERRPALLHLRVVRLLGHAGSDMEGVYRSAEEIERDEARDPLVASAKLLVAGRVATGASLVEAYEAARARVASMAADAVRRPKLTSSAQVMAPLAPPDPAAVADEAARSADEPARRAFWRGRLPEEQRRGTLAQSIQWALGDLLVRYPEVMIFGQDVAHKGGVYGVTRDLWQLVRPGRVFDTLLDEQTILGLAIGLGHLGALPIAEIQYLAYLHNAEDQLRGEAASLAFFSRGQFKNPMIVRVAGYAYQKGFGGHFHNDNSVAVLRDIPGIVVASPARGDDAAGMLRTCVAAARRAGAVCVFLEPIALYHVRDLHGPGDEGWCSRYDPAAPVPLGAARLWSARPDDALLVVSWANGVWMSLRAQKRLREQHGLGCRVLDLRWLAPLPTHEVLANAREVGRVLVVDETRRSGGVSEALVTALAEGGFAGPVRRVTSADSFVPLGDAANLVLVQEEDIERAALELAQRAPDRTASAGAPAPEARGATP